MAVGITDGAITKPHTDNREYRRIVLPNSLEVLLISDPETDKCAASMSVGVGYFSDPEGLEGLAHFLEHMLFYASEKYPVEDSYSKYITEHGGSTNAYTSTEHTNYFFDVNTDSFEEALDRFAQFFIKPLMSADATTREIKAVDSENQKNLLSDAWRMTQLQQHLSTEGHPYHKFGTGNWDTLEVRPKQKGLDTRNELIKFYEEHYSSNIMRLVIYGKKNLDDLQSLVDQKFKEIRNTDKNCFHFSGQPCKAEHVQILVKAIPIKQGHKLKIVWPITPSILHYKEAPCRYLGHLIGHEGEGSLFCILKTLGWATGLSAGEDDSSNDYAFFKVNIDLTDSGNEHMEDIVGLLFKYVILLQQSGVSKWIFDELSAFCETAFHYQDKTRPINYVAKVSSNMQLYPAKDWLVGSSLPSNFSSSIIQMILDELTPENVRIFWESKIFEGQTDKVEPWYGTGYSLENINSSAIQQWISAAPNQNLHLPAPNVFIPTDLSIKDLTEKVKFPVLLRKSSYSKLWYKPDTMFFTPKAHVKIDFNCPYTSHTPEAVVLTDVFTRLVMDYLNEYAYDAQVAGLYYGINSTDTGFQVIVTGYNHKMRILVDKIIEQIQEFKVKPERFAVIKETVLKEYQNYKFQQPYQQAMYYCSLILADASWPWTEQLEVIPHLEAADLAKFSTMLLSKAFVECYAAGNIEPKEAEEMVIHIEDIFFKGLQPIARPLFPSEHLTNRIVKLESGISHFYPAEVLNPSDENSALVHYIQVHQDSTMLNVKLQLFALIAKQPVFHQLRSVEQLGYITVLMQRNDSGIRGLQFIVQSTAKDPGQIDLRVESFLEEFESKLYEMPADEFMSNVNALIDMKLEKHKNLSEETSFFWREIFDGTLKFDRREIEIAALKNLRQQELIDFFNEYIKVGAPVKKTLSVQVYGGSHSGNYEASTKEISSNPQSVLIEDIFSFRRSQPLYGSFKGGSGLMKL
ncbi:insulin-degrading enzyme-like 1, peroxisomal [Papaver somniferum]|uniref:insulin-degrading enzyme-like 1, peroxisomal n=1 Tax=Papaver somniferum TaxID=3469 RepID=UPI000E6F5350|nr:insulin-degrading enzyme-like 1, peroxisomal [Papaver somniferum]